MEQPVLNTPPRNDAIKCYTTNGQELPPDIANKVLGGGLPIYADRPIEDYIAVRTVKLKDNSSFDIVQFQKLSGVVGERKSQQDRAYCTRVPRIPFEDEKKSNWILFTLFRRLADACSQHYSSGTTLTVVCCDGESLKIANVGDSPAKIIIVNDDGDVVADFSTDEHKPISLKEFQRIIRAGGDVRRTAVCNNTGMELEVARALGDADFGTIVSANPSIYPFFTNKDVEKLNLKDSYKAYVIVASDGYNLSNFNRDFSAAYKKISKELNVNTKDPTFLYKLTKELMNCGNKNDNTTFIIMPLDLKTPIKTTTENEMMMLVVADGHGGIVTCDYIYNNIESTYRNVLAQSNNPNLPYPSNMDLTALERSVVHRNADGNIIATNNGFTDYASDIYVSYPTGMLSSNNETQPPTHYGIDIRNISKNSRLGSLFFIFDADYQRKICVTAFTGFYGRLLNHQDEITECNLTVCMVNNNKIAIATDGSNRIYRLRFSADGNFIDFISLIDERFYAKQNSNLHAPAGAKIECTVEFIELVQNKKYPNAISILVIASCDLRNLLNEWFKSKEKMDVTQNMTFEILKKINQKYPNEAVIAKMVLMRNNEVHYLSLIKYTSREANLPSNLLNELGGSAVYYSSNLLNELEGSAVCYSSIVEERIKDEVKKEKKSNTASQEIGWWSKFTSPSDPSQTYDYDIEGSTKTFGKNA